MGLVGGQSIPCHFESVVAQWLAHLPLVLEVRGSIPGPDSQQGKVMVSEHTSLSVICRDLPSDRDINWMSPVQGSHPMCMLKNPMVI